MHLAQLHIVPGSQNSEHKKPFFQPKLTIDQPNDVYERGAGAVADKVRRTHDDHVSQQSFFKPSIRNVQRKCAHCEEEEKHMQRKENSNNEVKPSSGTEGYINNLPGGSALNERERSFFEPLIGHDLSGVRLHTDGEANASARSINALAFTAGNNIVFGRGAYDPGTGTGKRLLAHELAHVVQQGGAASPARIQRQNPPAGAAPAAQPNCQTPQSPKGESTDSDLFKITPVTPPCYACPNSTPDACPKLAQEIFPPVATAPVQFSWQVRFNTIFWDKGIAKPGRGNNINVVQTMEKIFNFSTAQPAYAFTPLYWESFLLDDAGQSERDFWQFELPDLTSGTWEVKSSLYLTEQTAAEMGMAVGNVPDAGGAPSTLTEPKKLGRILGTRRITGRFDFTGATKRHSFQ